MDVRFVAGFAVITRDQPSALALYADTLDLPLRAPESVRICHTPYLRD